jgi:enoyl-CoA hydratase
MAQSVLYEVRSRVAQITINRPEARNAMNADVLDGLWRSFSAAEDEADVDVVILTGADPAFCAGMDLKELASRPVEMLANRAREEPRMRRFFPVMAKPVIAAVNGHCVTGGLELALQCSFMVASERARFADTHARVGVMPNGGMTVLLPQAIGVRRAREMSLTGNYVDASEALALGLVNHVVAHEELLKFSHALAADVVEVDQGSARHLLATYDLTSATTVVEGLRQEALSARRWSTDGAEIERRRAAIMQRGRQQTH